MLSFQIERFDHGLNELHTCNCTLYIHVKVHALHVLWLHEVEIEINVMGKACIWQNIVRHVVDQACEL